MITSRVSTFAQNQLLLAQALERQAQLAETQRQVSTGLKADTYAGLARQSSALISAQSVEAKLETYTSSNREVLQKLDVYNLAVGEVAGIADTLRQDLIGSVNLNSGLGLIEKLENAFQRLTSVLNTRYQGRYVFSGTRTDTPPVNVSNVTDLLALPASANAFDNNQKKQQAQVDDGQVMEYGVLADDVAGPLVDAFYRIFQFNSGTLPAGAGAFGPAGAFTDPLQPNQAQFLINEFSNAVAAIDAARQEEAQNGVDLESLDRLIIRQDEDKGFIAGFIADIRDVDITEAAARLNQDEVALTAALQTVARVSRISLLNFL